MADNTNYVSFENTYIMGKADLESDCPALACGAIDGYPADENGQGTVICNVWLLPNNQFLVDWHHNGYRMNTQVLDLIETTKRALLGEKNPPRIDGWV